MADSRLLGPDDNSKLSLWLLLFLFTGRWKGKELFLVTFNEMGNALASIP